MTRFGYGLVGLAAIGIALGSGLAWRETASPPREEARMHAPAKGTSSSGEKAVQAAPTLCCEFTNFADRNPRVGFYFAIEDGRQPPVYAQIFRRERDGAQTDFGADGSPRPEWRFEGAENPAVLRSPDDGTAINLHDYDPGKTGTTWFEAGLRSIRYLNLGGKCRRSGT